MNVTDQTHLKIKEEIIRVQEELKTASKKQEVELKGKLKELKDVLARIKMKSLLQKALGDYKDYEGKNRKTEKQ